MCDPVPTTNPLEQQELDLMSNIVFIACEICNSNSNKPTNTQMRTLRAAVAEYTGFVGNYENFF
jgi:hypothetical protein